MRAYKSLVLIGLLAGAASAATPALAGNATATLNARVFMNGTCTVSVAGNGLDFGQLDNLTTAKSTTASVSVNCPNGQAYTLTVMDGAAAATRTRTLKNGTNTINYVLATDAALTALSPISQTGTGAAQTHTIYGNIPTSTTTTTVVGAYTDSLTISVSY